MSEVRIRAEQRTEFGKGGARRTRRAGLVPAVIYGHGQPPRHISLPAREITLALRADANALLRLDLVDGDSELALAKDVQRDPLKQTIDHVDLIVVRRGEKVTVEIPITLVGEHPADVLLNHDLTTLSVAADATAIPSGVELDISAVEVGTTITAGELALPDGATLVTDADTLVVSGLAAPTAAQLEAEVAEAEAEVGAGEVSGPPAEEAGGETDVSAAPEAGEAAQPADA